MLNYKMSVIRHKGRFSAMTIVLLALVGCGEKPTVVSYQIPKEYGKAILTWKTPADWDEDPAAPGPNVVSFVMQGKNGQTGKLAAMPFGAEVAMIDVANMFGRELGLGSLSENSLAKVIEKKNLGLHEFEIANLGNLDANASDPQGQASATLALLAGERETWLFAMIAEDAMIEGQRANFEQFLGSLTVIASKEGPEEDTADSFLRPQVNPGTPPPFDPPAAGPTVGRPEWKVPAGWEERPASGPRVATFAAKGESDGELEISVTSFHGSMGGPLANLNRWRGQLGLKGITEAQLPEHAVARDVGGRAAYLVILKNGAQAMLAAMILDDERSWFVKASGAATLTESQQPNFEAFLDSIRFPAP